MIRSSDGKGTRGYGVDMAVKHILAKQFIMW